MRILHVIDSGGLYGAERMLLTLAAEQMAMGSHPTICSIGTPKDAEKPVEREACRMDIPVHELRMTATPSLSNARSIVDAAIEHKADVIHSHGYKGNILLGFLPKSKRPIPILSTLHGWTHTRGFSKMGLYGWLDARALRRIDRVALVSSAMLEHPRLRSLDRAKIAVVPNGLPPEIPADKTSSLTTANAPADWVEVVARFLEPPNVIKIGSFGRLSEEKNQKLLVRSFAQLIERDIDARLLLLGDGDERDGIEELVRSFGLGNRVMMPGYLPNAPQLMTQLDVFALPSATEGFPMVILEAMRARVPIVASSVGDIPLMLEDGQAGRLVTAGDQAQLTEALEQMISDEPMRRDLANRAHEKFAREFTARVMADRYQSEYEICVRDTAPVSP